MQEKILPFYLTSLQLRTNKSFNMTGKDSQDVPETGSPDVEQCRLRVSHGLTSTDPSKNWTKPYVEFAFFIVLVCAAALIGGLVFGKYSGSAVDVPTKSQGDAAKTNDPQNGNAYKCFESHDELLRVVIGYMGNNRPEVVELYGDIRDWCVGLVTDFTAVFRDQKDFNEPLDWDGKCHTKVVTGA